MSAVASREKILKAASELFLQGGLMALSVRAIAKRAGLSTIGIYSHFEGKQGILDALYIEGFERVAAAMEIKDRSLDARTMVLAASNAYLDVAEQYGAHYRLIFGEADETYTPSEAARQVAARAFAGLLSLTEHCYRDEVPRATVEKRAIEIWAILHGYVGLANHAVAKQISIGDWRELALQTVNRTLDVNAAAIKKPSTVNEPMA